MCITVNDRVTTPHIGNGIEHDGHPLTIRQCRNSVAVVTFRQRESKVVVGGGIGPTRDFGIVVELHMRERKHEVIVARVRKVLPHDIRRAIQTHSGTLPRIFRPAHQRDNLRAEPSNECFRVVMKQDGFPDPRILNRLHLTTARRVEACGPTASRRERAGVHHARTISGSQVQDHIHKAQFGTLRGFGVVRAVREQVSHRSPSVVSAVQMTYT